MSLPANNYGCGHWISENIATLRESYKVLTLRQCVRSIRMGTSQGALGFAANRATVGLQNLIDYSVYTLFLLLSWAIWKCLLRAMYYYIRHRDL